MAPRNEAIDAGRGFAILSVILFHYLARWTPPFSFRDFYGYSYVYPVQFELGQFGVHIFFVISGLVIAMTLMRCRSGIEFAVRRIARIYPAYAVAVLLTFFVVRLSGPAEWRVGVYDLVRNFFLVFPNTRLVDGVYWTLIVEIKFYFFAFISFALLRERFWIAIAALGVAGGLTAFVAPSVAKYVLLAPYMPLFLLGMAGWYYIYAHRHREAYILAALAGVLYTLSASKYEVIANPAWSAHLYILGLSIVLLALVASGCAINFAPLTFIGRISYPLYLVHQRVGVVVISTCTARGMPDAIAIAIAMASVLLLACALHYLIENPTQRLIMRAYNTKRAPRLRQAPSAA